MKKTIFFITVCIFWTIANAQNTKHYIFFYNPVTSISENNFYDTPHGVFFDLKTQNKNLALANAEADVNMAIAHKDMRFVALSFSNTYLYPGTEPKNSDLIKRYKFKVIQGTGAIKNKNEPSLQRAATLYASKYNKLLLLKMRH